MTPSHKIDSNKIPTIDKSATVEFCPWNIPIEDLTFPAYVCRVISHEQAQAALGLNDYNALSAAFDEWLTGKDESINRAIYSVGGT